MSTQPPPSRPQAAADGAAPGLGRPGAADWLQDLRVLVLGLGSTGLAMARWCARCGAVVTVWDSRSQPPQAAALAAEVSGATLVGGALSPDHLAGVQLVLKSPGLAPHDARIAALLDEARAIGIAILGELDLFVRALADLQRAQGDAPQVLAITGTNGKTTTTAMTALLVQRSGKRVAVAGNIGPTLLDTLAAALQAPREQWPQVWVLELSSFQLDGVRNFEPSAAAVLNISQDHLDWHGTVQAYTAAKARVFGATTVRVINRDDAAVQALSAQRPQSAQLPPLPSLAARAKPKAGAAAALAPPPVVRFGLDAPRHPGDFGLVVDKGMAWLVRALPSEQPGKRRKAANANTNTGADDGNDTIHLQHLMPADALRVRGRHNAANALAALALASAIGCPLAPMLHALRSYGGEPHRLQPAGMVGDVQAWDDSKGTNVGATVAALLGLGEDIAPARLVVILGGDGKGQDFTPLAAPLARHARAVATIGRDAGRIEAVIAGVPWQRHASLPDAVAWCFAQARPGDAVLLSPACASLDMFSDYAHRAAVFVSAVQALAQDQGALA